MDDTSTESDTRAPCYLPNLPYELKLHVLMRLPDKASLKALLQASPVFYDVYSNHRHKILISISNLPDMSNENLTTALAIWESQPGSRVNFITLMPLMFRGIRWMSSPDDLCTLLPIESYPTCKSFQYEALLSQHAEVEEITQLFFTSALSLHPITGEKLAAPKPLSREETARIQRAIYRFALFCIGFMHAKLESNIAYAFKTQSRFEPWELEEIACIYDFGEKAVKALKDTAFSEMYFKLQRSGRFPVLMLFFLERGLTTLLGMMKASSKEERGIFYFMERRKRSGCRLGPRPLSREELDQKLTEDRSAVLAACQDFLEPDHTRPVLHGSKHEFANEKEGANAAWIWSNNELYTCDFWEPKKVSMRKWGYVFWDRSRLEDMKILEDDPKNLLDTPKEQEA